MFKASLAAALALTLLQSRQPTPTIKSGTAVVTVDAIALDDEGNVVTDSSAADFEVFEDGKPMPVTAFVPPGGSAAPGQSPRLVVLMLDDYTSPPLGIWRIKEMARGFVDRMGANDVMAVVTLNGGHATTSTSPEAARAAIEAFRPSPPTTIPQSSRNETALKAIRDLARQLEDVRQMRKTLVCLCSPYLFTDATSRTTHTVWLDTSRAASRANASLYIVDPGGLAGRSNRFLDDATSLTIETGGVAFLNTNFLERSVAQIWDEAGHYYLLGYAQPPANGRKQHAIEVKVTRPGVGIRARRERG